MNKTKKDKYLRKNRRISKKNKNKKNKTRKVQRGGVVAVEAAAAAQAEEEKKAATEKAAAQAEAEKAAEAEKKAAAENKKTAEKENAAAEAATEAAEAAHFGQFRQFRQPKVPNMMHDFGNPDNDTVPADVTNASPASTENAEKVPINVYDPKMSPEEKVAYFTQNALKRNVSRQRPDRRITLLAKSIPNAILGKLGSIGSESQKKLADGEVLNEFIGDLSEIIKDSEDQVAIVREYNRLLTEEITDIYNKTGKNGTLTEEHKGHIHDLLGDITKNNETIKRLTITPVQLVRAMQTGNIDVLESQFGTQSQFGSQSGMLGNGSSKPGKRNFFSKDVKSPAPGTPAETPPGTQAGTPPGTAGKISKQPGFFKRMGNKISGSFTRKKPTPEEEAKQKAIEEGRQQPVEEQKDFDVKNKLTRVKTGLIPTFTRGVKEKFSNAGQAVKTGVSNMGQAVKTGFNSARQKFSKKNSANDSERLISNPVISNNTPTTEQKNSWRERLVNMKQGASAKFGSLKKTATNAKDAAVARFTRKNRGNENPESENTRLLNGDKEEIEMQNIEPTPTPQPSQPTTPAAPGAAPPRPPPPERPEELKRAIETRKAAAAPAETPTPPPSQPSQVPSRRQPPPVPSRPTSFSALSQQATVPPSLNSNDFDDYKSITPNVKINPINTTVKPTDSVPLLPPPPGAKRIRSNFPDMINLTDYPVAAGGGNKTRKNGQYMREIKDNRTHLFNKEMQILNSIRNFKHGHIDNDNTKKQFMKAVKRG